MESMNETTMAIGLALALLGASCQDRGEKIYTKKDPVETTPKKKTEKKTAPKKKDPVLEKKQEKKEPVPKEEPRLAALDELCTDRDCAPGLSCQPKIKTCEAEECELGSTTCKKGTVCCPMPAAKFPSPLCLPDCRGKPAGFCGQLLGANAECNAEMRCCHHPKVLRRPK